MNNKIKLVQVIADSAIGGGPKHVFGLLSNLDKTKFEVLLIAPRGWLTTRASSISGVKVKIVDFKNKWDLASLLKLRRNIAEFRSDNPFGPIVIHAHGPRAASFCKLILRSKERFIYTEHIWNNDYHLKNPINAWLQKNGLRSVCMRANKIIAVSKSVKKFLISDLDIRDSKISVIPNAIEIESDKIERPKENGTVVGTIGSLNKQKGHLFLIQAFERVAKSLPKAKLEIVGDGPEKASLLKEIKNRNLESKIQLLGKIDRPKKIMKNWDLFVLPSLSETFGLVILEAFEAQVPVVATKVGGIPEIITNNENGILVSPGDVEKLAKAILFLLVEKKERQQLSAKAYDLLKKKYDWSKIIVEIENEYCKLVQ